MAALGEKVCMLRVNLKTLLMLKMLQHAGLNMIIKQ